MRVKSYEELIIALYRYCTVMATNHFKLDDETFNELCQQTLAAISKATLYCSKNAFEDVKCWGKRIELLTSSEAMLHADHALTHTLDLLREDIENCRRYKFD